MYTIDKRFDICYGHRVHNQTLNDEYTEEGHTCPKCRHIHGHQGAIHVFLEAEDDMLKRGMVVDFTWLGWFKEYVDNNLDHKFIIDRNDPWFQRIINGRLTTVQKAAPFGQETRAETVPVLDISGVAPAQENTTMNHMVELAPLPHIPERYLELIPSRVPGTEHLGGYNLDVSELEGPEQEFYEGFFIVDFLPTSENLSKWVYDCVDAKMSLIDVKTAQVDWFETPKSRSSYRG